MKKRWFIYPIIGISIFATLMAALFGLWTIDDIQGQPRIDNIYSKFENIEFANEIYCSAKDNYGSFNHQIINISNISFSINFSFKSNWALSGFSGR